MRQVSTSVALSKIERLLEEVAADPKKIHGEARQQLFVLMGRIDERMREPSTTTGQMLQYADLLTKIGNVVPKENPALVAAAARPTFSVIINPPGKLTDKTPVVEVVAQPPVPADHAEAPLTLDAETGEPADE